MRDLVPISLEWEVAQLLQAEHILGQMFSIYGNGKLNKRVIEDNIYSASDDLECQRCGYSAPRLLRSWHPTFEGEVWEESGDPVPEEYRETWWVCIQCEHEMMNGSPSNLDISEIEEDRAEQAYYEDPINNPCPWGCQ
jgi:hypothetical protein